MGLHACAAHSTRGACATALLAKGVPKGVVKQLGDWKSEGAFEMFYNRLRCSQPWQQCLVPHPVDEATSFNLDPTPPRLLALPE